MKILTPLYAVFGGVLLAAAVAACKDATGTSAAPVASIEIIGVPAELFVGASVTLDATPRDASGNALSNRPVSWISSDSTVAAVNAHGVVTGRRPGDAVIVATSEQKSATATVKVAIEPVASVEILGIPTGPVAAGTTVQLSAVARNAAGAPLTNRTFFWISTNYSVATVSAAGLVQAVKGGQVLIGVNCEGKTASFTLQVFDPVASVSVTPSPVVMYPAQTLQLTATPRSAADAPLTDRAVVWSSSDPQKATVDAAGRVTAVAEGEVSINATSEGKTGSASVTILPRHAADWSQATAWTTHQGSARHTGYVPVTADPVVFRELWVRSPLGANVPLNPVTEGDGRVFVSSVAYFGGQKMAAVNAATGANAWTYDFGGIHGVHPPAYGNGRVYVTTSGHQDSFLWAFSAASGTVAFRSKYGNQWSRYFAPVVLGETVYMAGGYYDGMYAFDAAGGEERWFASTNQYDQWTPAVADGRVYAYTGSYQPALAVHDAASGETLFSIADPGFRWGGWSMGISPVLGARNNVLATQGGAAALVRPAGPHPRLGALGLVHGERDRRGRRALRHQQRPGGGAA